MAIKFNIKAKHKKSHSDFLERNIVRETNADKLDRLIIYAHWLCEVDNGN